VEFNFAFLLQSLGSTFFGIEVILTGFSGQNLAVFGDFNALFIGFVGFHRYG